MADQEISPSHFSEDIREFLRLLHRHNVEYLIVGGEAVIYYGVARLTGDLDFFYDRSPGNANRLFEALTEFWSGEIPGIEKREELLEEGLIIQFGRPPNRIDLMNAIERVSFAEAWADRETVRLAGEAETVPVYYISIDHLIRNKEGAGRPRDLEDLKYLYELR
jgi:hypothetical protein